MNEEYCIILTTFSEEKNGRRIIDTLIEKRLAACIQVIPIQSFYRWQGEVNRDNEQLMLIKTKQSLYVEVEKFILTQHAYEIPEVVLLPIEHGFAGYLEWISDVCR